MVRDSDTSQTSKGTSMISQNNSQSFQKLFLNIMKSVVEQFFTRFAKFRDPKEAAKFMRPPDSMKMEEMNL